MTVFTVAELAGMRDVQKTYMPDACQIGTVHESQDTIGQPVPEPPSYSVETPCGLQMTGGLQRNEFRTAEGTVVYADAKLRLPYDAVVSVMDVVKITKRYGAVVTPIVYEVMGAPLSGPTGIVCYLRQVTT